MNPKQLIDQPIRACWLLTSRCNYTCQFCHRVLDKRELYFNEAVIVADKLIKSGIRKISFSGGEPMMWSGLFDLIQYVKKRGVITMLITNASFLTDARLDRYANILDWITFPIDGSTEEMQEKMTRDAGHLKRVLRFLKQIEEKDLPIRVKINTVFARPNQGDMANIARIVRDYPAIERWKVFQFYPIRGLALRFQKKFSISKRRFLESKREVFNTFPEWKNKSVYFATNKDLERSYFTLAPDGSVYLSYESKDYYMGDLKKEPVEEIWQNKMYDKGAHEIQASWMSDYLVDSSVRTLHRLKRESGVLGGGVL